MKLLGNFRKLIDYVSADSTYNPSNAALAKIALEAQYTAALAAVQQVATKMAPNKIAISNRQTAFEGLDSLVKRSRNLLKATGTPGKVLDDAETFVRKLTGTRKSPKTKDVRDDCQGRGLTTRSNPRPGSKSLIVRPVLGAAPVNRTLGDSNPRDTL